MVSRKHSFLPLNRSGYILVPEIHLPASAQLFLVTKRGQRARLGAFPQQLRVVWRSVSFNSSLRDLLLTLRGHRSLQDALPRRESREEELC